MKKKKNLFGYLLPEPRDTFLIVSFAFVLSDRTVGDASLVVARIQVELVGTSAGKRYRAQGVQVTVGSRIHSRNRSQQAQVRTPAVVVAARVREGYLAQVMVNVQIVRTVSGVPQYFVVVSCGK